MKDRETQLALPLKRMHDFNCDSKIDNHNCNFFTDPGNFHISVLVSLTLVVCLILLSSLDDFKLRKLFALGFDSIQSKSIKLDKLVAST